MSTQPLNANRNEPIQSFLENSIIVDLLHCHPFEEKDYSEEMNRALRKHSEKGSPMETIIKAVLLPYEYEAQGKLTRAHWCWEESGITVGVIDVDILPSKSLYAGKLLEILKHIPWITVARTAKEIREARKLNIHSFFFIHQPVDPIPNICRNISLAYELGLRIFVLTYNQNNQIGSGCLETMDYGLTDFGKKFISYLNKMGIIVDVSHSGPRTTIEACRLSTKPVIASHTGANSVFEHRRSKTDEELQAIAATDGVVGIYSVPSFISSNLNGTLNDMLDHIDYVVGLLGWEHVAIGMDWPLPGPRWISEQVFGKLIRSYGFRQDDPFDPTARLTDFRGYRDFSNIILGLIRREYSEEAIRGIIGENFLRVVSKVCG